MHNILLDIQFDEVANAMFTPPIANDFFVAPHDSADDTRLLWQKFALTLPPGNKILVVGRSEGCGEGLD